MKTPLRPFLWIQRWRTKRAIVQLLDACEKSEREAGRMMLPVARVHERRIPWIACVGLIALAECACTTEPAPLEATQRMADVAITVDAETRMEPASLAAFSRYAQRQISVWNDGLEARGCERPFAFTPELGLSSMRVVLAGDVTTRFPANGGGYFDGHDVWLQANTDGTYDQTIRINWPAIMQHELGHALGLPHNMRDDSVMGPSFSLVTESDLEDAARSIGCE